MERRPGPTTLELRKRAGTWIVAAWASDTTGPKLAVQRGTVWRGLRGASSNGSTFSARGITDRQAKPCAALRRVEGRGPLAACWRSGGRPSD